MRFRYTVEPTQIAPRFVLESEEVRLVTVMSQDARKGQTGVGHVPPEVAQPHQAIGVGVLPGDDRSPTRAAECRRGEVIHETHAPLSEPVKIGRGQERVPTVATELGAEIVGDDEKDVWSFVHGWQHSSIS